MRNDSGIKSPKDFANKVFASPQLGNTQDISLRKYLQDNGYKTKDNGGNVTVVSTDNPIILTVMTFDHEFGKNRICITCRQNPLQMGNGW